MEKKLESGVLTVWAMCLPYANHFRLGGPGCCFRASCLVIGRYLSFYVFLQLSYKSCSQAQL
jgi:hypothetical protein